MEIVVNDTNILIDLHTIGLLDAFFKLPFGFHTLDLVLDEIRQVEQRDSVLCFVDREMLMIKRMSDTELMRVLELHASAAGNLSVTDCAVWAYAMDNGFTLLTGDRQLRNKAIKSGVTVRGILFLFEQLVVHGIVSPDVAIEKLQALQEINVRLPQKHVEEYIRRWRNM